jgi:threonine dehydratase
MRLPTIEDVRDAARRIEPYAVRTPLLSSPVLDALTGGRILLKAETLQRIGAFKFRGAYNKISRLKPADCPGGVVACSSGNHAQGVAEAARLMGLKAAIVMPADAPRIKIERTRALGAETVLYDRVAEDRDGIANRLCEERHAAIVWPFDDPDIIAGQGTTGLEIMEDMAALGLLPDLVLVPCSGGGLVSGVALAVKAAHPETEVVSVEPEGFDDYARSLKSGVRETNVRKSGSICDALMSEAPGKLTFAIAQHTLAGGLSVSEAEVRRAVRFAFEELKLVVEPGGAVGLAAILAGKVEARARTLVAVLSGGNVDPDLFAEIIGGRG